MALSAAGLAIVALTTRAVPSDERPLTSRDVAILRRSVDIGAINGMGAVELAREASMPVPEAERVLRLLGRATAVALALDSWEQSGIWTTTVVDPDYPAPVRERLADQAPAVLHGAGPVAALAAPLVGVVGSRGVTPDAASVASAAGSSAVAHGFGVVSGSARGVDALAMDAAMSAGGHAVGVLADSLVRVLRATDARRAILDGTLTLATPYAPAAPFSPGFAMGRNKIIYALAAHVLVVTSDVDRGGTWAGATEALDHGLADVAVWTGPGAGEGNAALATRGARAIDDVAALFDAPSRPPRGREPGDDQLSLAV